MDDDGGHVDLRETGQAVTSPTPSRRDVIRHRHRRGLQVVAEAYRPAGGIDTVVDTALATVTALGPALADDEVFLAACIVVRERSDPESIRSPTTAGAPAPRGLMELVADADGATGPAEGTDADKRRSLLTAYDSLPDRDRVVLWFTAVEGSVPVDLAARTSIGRVDDAATLAHRVRSRLRRAYAHHRLRSAEPATDCPVEPDDLVGLVDGATGGAAAEALVAHRRGCSRCQVLTAELVELPTPLLTVAAELRRRLEPTLAALGSGGPGALPRSAAATEPVLITTTPGVAAPTEAVSPVPPEAAPAAGPHDAGPGETEDPDRRRRMALIVVVTVVVVAVLAVTGWLIAGRASTQPVEPGEAPTTRPVPSPATTAAATDPPTTSSATTASSTSSTTSTAPSTTARSGGSVPATAPAWSPATPAWTPPASATPSDPVPTTAAVTTPPPTTSPPTTAGPPPTTAAATTTPPAS